MKKLFLVSLFLVSVLGFAKNPHLGPFRIGEKDNPNVRSTYIYDGDTKTTKVQRCMVYGSSIYCNTWKINE